MPSQIVDTLTDQYSLRIVVFTAATHHALWKQRASSGWYQSKLAEGQGPVSGRSMSNPFRYFNSSPEVIRLVVMMYVKYPLSLRNVEDLLFERGIDICHETVRLWRSEEHTSELQSLMRSSYAV